MGTARLICIYHAGRFVVAQHGGYDGYPEGAGRDVMKSIEFANIQRLRSKLAFIHYRKHQADGDYLQDDLGVAILDDIACATGPILHSFALDFAHEGSLCEWVYFIDLDAEVLEVYYGVSERTRPMGQASVGSLSRLAEVGICRQWLKVTIPFIDLPGEEGELVKACTSELCDDDHVREGISKGKNSRSRGIVFLDAYGRKRWAPLQ